MDVDRCLSRLELYANLLASYQQGSTNQPTVSAIWQVAAEAKRIAEAVEPGLGDAILPTDTAFGGIETTGAQMAANYAIGRLRNDAALDEMLATPGPKLEARTLHPWVWDAARPLWEAQHFRLAVQQGATSVLAHVENITGRRDLQDTQVMQEALSEAPPKPGRPRLVWPGEDDDKTVKSMRDGLRRYAPGVVLTIRNPATHEQDEYLEHEALERLAALSLLARWVEQCELATADEDVTSTPD